jgi:hypothetical protein
MDNSLVVDNDGDSFSRLMFETNGSGIVLISHHRNTSFTAEEFQYYQCLFKLTDISDIGKLKIGSLPFYSILRRTSLSSKVNDVLITIALNSFTSRKGQNNKSVLNNDKNDVLNNTPTGNDVPIDGIIRDEPKVLKKKLLNGNSNSDVNHNLLNKSGTVNSDPEGNMFNNCINDNDTSTIKSGDNVALLSLHQWLMLCKMIGHLQHNPSVALNDSLLEVVSYIHNNDREDNKENNQSKYQHSSIKGMKKCIYNDNNNLNGNSSNDIPSINTNIGNNMENQFANFHMGVPVLNPISTDMIIDSKVCGWELSNEGFQRSHVKFVIRTVCRNHRDDGKKHTCMCIFKCVHIFI